MTAAAAVLGGPQGWIAREQILGAEAEARVPEKFRNQDASIANPPTLLLALAALLAQYEAGAPGAPPREFLEFAFERLQRYFGWLLRSQVGARGCVCVLWVWVRAWVGRWVGACLRARGCLHWVELVLGA